jgi:hypothetical protein
MFSIGYWIWNEAPDKDDGCEESNELARHCKVYMGVEEVLHHLASVAAGMTYWPRRPDRDTLFRPFSSWDAQVLLQLKRTKEVAMGRRINQLLEYALRSGKAVRNPQLVPDLHLLQQYGTGDSSKYSTEPPQKNYRSGWLWLPYN